MSKKGSDRESDRKVFAFLAVFLTVIGFIIALIAKKTDDEYVKFYAKQGLILFIGQVIIWIVTMLPFFSFRVIESILWIFWVVLWIIAWVNALSGEKRNTWLVQDLAK